MNRSNFNQTGGYPLKTERLQEMQTAYSIFNSLGYIIGDLTIIEGCHVLQAGNVSSGFVFINGEVLEFQGGFVSQWVIIVEEAAQKEFQNGQLKPVHFKRYATFGVPGGQIAYSWAAFKRGMPTKDIQAALDLKATVTALNNAVNRITELEKKAAVFSAGAGMVLWRKPLNQIPPGWQEVEDWRGRLPMGWNPNDEQFDTLLTTGGSKTKTLSINEMPSHTHGVSVHGSDSGNGNGRIQGGTNEPVGTNNVDVQPAGNGHPFSILNPYRIVMFIEYIG